MLAPIEAQGSSPDRAHGGPDVATCILALIDSLSGTEGYTVEARNGELFVTPVQPRNEAPGAE
jgi:hypothetical protein